MASSTHSTQGHDGSVRPPLCDEESPGTSKRPKIGHTEEANVRCYLEEMPVDVFFEIASHLTQRDLLSLCEVSKQYRAVLISSTANQVWIKCRSASGIPMPAEVPEWRVGNHERFSAMVLHPLRCNLCGKGINGDEFVIYFIMHVGACQKCPNKPVHFSKLSDPTIHPRALELTIREPGSWTPQDHYQNSYLYQRPFHFYLSEAVLAVSEDLKEIEASSRSTRSKRKNLAADQSLNAYATNRLEKLSERARIGKEMWFAMERIRAEKEKADRVRKAALREARLREIERLIRLDGWTDRDLGTSWGQHHLVDRWEPISDDDHESNGWLSIGPILQAWLESERAYRLKQEATYRLEARKKVLISVRNSIIQNLSKRYALEFLPLEEFLDLDEVKSIFDSPELEQDSGVETARVLATGGRGKAIVEVAERRTREYKLAFWKKVSVANELVERAIRREEEAEGMEQEEAQDGEDAASVADGEGADEEEPLPSPADPFPEDFEDDMDADFARFTNRFECTHCHRRFLFPEIRTHCCYRRSGNYYSSHNDVTIDWRRVGVERLLLNMLGVRDQRTTEKTLESRKLKLFSCVTCEDDEQAILVRGDTHACDFGEMVKHAIDKHPEDEDVPWTFPHFVLQFREVAYDRFFRCTRKRGYAT